MAQRVFVSYRRSDSAHQATALKIVLGQKLPEASVFVDTASINPAERWPDRLTTALERSSAVVALIGPHWRFAADGTDRFADPEDWVLRELAYGLERKADAVIPVFFGTTTEAAYQDLPPALASLPGIQALELRQDADWSHGVDRLASTVAKLLGTVAIEKTIHFPTPNELKKHAPRLIEAEFDEYKLKVSRLAGWMFSRVPVSTADGEVEGTQISRSFTFANFKSAFTFMARSAEWAETRSHHPDWTNVWNRVDVRLRTFDAGQSVTWYDIEMACAMHDVAQKVARENKVGWPLRPLA